jgi:hypothetical protein
MDQAFNPLGVYLNFWQPTLKAGEMRDYTVAMVNDEDRSRTGKLQLVFSNAEGSQNASETSFSLPPLGAQSYTITLRAPAPGAWSLKATAIPTDDLTHPTISHRDVVVQDSVSKD